MGASDYSVWVPVPLRSCRICLFALFALRLWSKMEECKARSGHKCFNDAGDSLQPVQCIDDWIQLDPSAPGDSSLEGVLHRDYHYHCWSSRISLDCEQIASPPRAAPIS